MQFGSNTKTQKATFLPCTFALGNDRHPLSLADQQWYTLTDCGSWNRAKAKGYLTLGEGDSDTQTLWFHKEPALGFPGADTWQEIWVDYLTDISIIYVYFEPDKGGEAVRKWLSKSKIRERVRLLNLGEHKDPSALYLANPRNTSRTVARNPRGGSSLCGGATEGTQ